MAKDKKWTVTADGNYEPTGRLVAKMLHGTWAQIETYDGGDGRYYTSRVKTLDRIIVGKPRRSLAAAKRDAVRIMENCGLFSE